MQSERLQNNCSTFELKYEEYQERGLTLENLIVGKYKIERRLDYGSESEVYFAINIQTEQEVAVKLINMRAINNYPNQKVRQICLKCVQNQILTMCSFNNPYLLQCYDLYQNQDFKLLIIEYCNGETLESYIQRKKKIPQKKAWKILNNIYFGLKALHDNQVVLRDLKADNIIRKNGVFKIANFHYAQQLSIKDTAQEIRGPCMGSLKLMSPQIILRKPYGLKIDIWALGIMFFQMLYGDYPFACEKITHFYDKIAKKDYFSKQQAPQMNDYKASPLSFKFLKLTLCIDSQKRADAKNLYQFLLMNDLLLEFQSELQTESLLLQNTTPKYTITQADKQIEGNPSLLHQINKQCCKVNFIITKIIKQIRHAKVQQFDDNREIVQFLYLVSVRCLNTITQVEAKMKQNIKHLKKQQQYTSISEIVNLLKTKACKYFNIYTQKLTILEDKVTSKIADWFSKTFNYEKFSKKQRFFVGIQKLQYSKQEQIKYTLKYYNKYVVKQLQKYSQLESVILHMNQYEQINQSDCIQTQSVARKSVVYCPIEY